MKNGKSKRGAQQQHCKRKQNIIWNLRNYETMRGNFKQYCSTTHVQLSSANAPYLNEPAINEQGTRQNEKL